MRHETHSSEAVAARRGKAETGARREGVTGDAPAALLALQASAGNAAVTELIMAHHHPADMTPVQRKVFIEGKLWGWRHKTKTGAARGGQGVNPALAQSLAAAGAQQRLDNRNVATMIADAPRRYFTSKAELSQYATGATANIGYLPTEDQWIRLGSQLLVLGETHTADTTLVNIARAVGTNKFRYEPFTAGPAGLDPASQVAAALEARRGEFAVRMGLIGNLSAHNAEDFFPKILRGLTGVTIQGQNIGASQPEMLLLKIGILYALENPGVSAHVDAHQQQFTALIPRLQGTMVATGWAGAGAPSIATFLQEFRAHADIQIAAAILQAPPADQHLFNTRWKLANPDYDVAGSPIMNAERARDFSIYQHIKQAAADGDLLFGMGKLHLERLENVLSDERIKHKTIPKFISDQAALYNSRA